MIAWGSADVLSSFCEIVFLGLFFVPTSIIMRQDQHANNVTDPLNVIILYSGSTPLNENRGRDAAVATESEQRLSQRHCNL